MVTFRRPFDRRSIRLRGFDYARPAGYFLTICSFERRCIFSEIEDQADVSIWQRNCYERVIRDAKQYAEICRYIQQSPLRWQLDEENPDNAPGSDWGTKYRAPTLS
jgi:hypothetical protein